VDDAVFEKLKEMKGEKSWEQFLVEPLIQKTKEDQAWEDHLKAVTQAEKAKEEKPNVRGD